MLNAETLEAAGLQLYIVGVICGIDDNMAVDFKMKT